MNVTSVIPRLQKKTLTQAEQAAKNQWIAETVQRISGAFPAPEFAVIDTKTSGGKIALGQFRHQYYCRRKSWMIETLDAEGLDNQDMHGTVFVATLQKEIISSIRLSIAPFETDNFLRSEKLQHFLGNRYHEEHLEWSRLLIQPGVRMARLLPALIVFAGMHVLARGGPHQYFGYCRAPMKRLFSRFDVEFDTAPFYIPERGPHAYYLLRGDFQRNLYQRALQELEE